MFKIFLTMYQISFLSGNLRRKDTFEYWSLMVVNTFVLRLYNNDFKFCFLLYGGWYTMGTESRGNDLLPT